MEAGYWIEVPSGELAVTLFRCFKALHKAHDEASRAEAIHGLDAAVAPLGPTIAGLYERLVDVFGFHEELSGVTWATDLDSYILAFQGRDWYCDDQATLDTQDCVDAYHAFFRACGATPLRTQIQRRADEDDGVTRIRVERACTA